MWTLAPSLDTLRDQVNALAPNRSKRSDGTIGDAAHAATKSDHNPDSAGVVRALDITHDPAGGLDVGALAAAIVASRDRRVKYLIYDRRVIGQQHWTWTPYDGADPHTSHLHVSVVADNRAFSTAPWAMPGARPVPAPPGRRALAVDGWLGEHTIRAWQQVMGTTADGVISTPSQLVAEVQRQLNRRHRAGLVVDGLGIASNEGGRYPAHGTTHTLRALQRHLGVTADGYLSAPSDAIKALQRRLNFGKF